MSGVKHIKQAIIASLCEHPEREKYKSRSYASDDLSHVMDAFNAAGIRIVKEDLFTPDDSGVYLINTPGFWKNFDAIRAVIGKNGETFSLEDFLRPLGAKPESKTLLEAAVQGGALGKIFTESLWTGRFDEMERLWYKVYHLGARQDLFKNEGKLHPSLKRKLLAAEGRLMPEDGLAQAGISAADLKAAFSKDGNYEELVRELAQGGDWLRKEYLLLPNGDGDTSFYHQAVWDKYNDIVAKMRAHGQRMEVKDFVRQVGRVNNPLARAAERDALDKVFNPEHWAGRLPDMLDLWSRVLPAWKTGRMTSADFDNAYAEAESLTYAKLIDVKALSAKADAFRILGGADAPVIPLGLKSFWEHYAAIEKKLAAQGESLTIADLRAKSGPLETTCLMKAVKFGRFADVAVISRRSQALTLDDYLALDSHGKTMLDVLAERKELALVFSPDLWIGRVNEMKALWSHVRLNDEAQVDIAQVETDVKQATLKQAGKTKKFKL